MLTKFSNYLIKFQFLIVLFIYFNVSTLIFSYEILNYGPFDYNFTSLQKIKGYKIKNLADVCIDLNLDDSGAYEISGNITVNENTGPISEDVKYYKMVGERYVPIFSIASSKMCDISVMSKFIHEFPLHDGKCGLKKGTTDLHLSINENMDAIFGGKFFYGKYKLHFIAFTSKGTVFAYTLLFETFPKKEIKL